MTIHTEVMHLVLSPDADEDKGIKYSLIPTRFKYYIADEEVVYSDEEISIVLPEMDEADILQKAIATLKDRQKAARATAEQKVLKLQEKINQYLQLSYVPEQ